MGSFNFQNILGREWGGAGGGACSRTILEMSFFLIAVPGSVYVQFVCLLVA